MGETVRHEVMYEPLAATEPPMTRSCTAATNTSAIVGDGDHAPPKRDDGCRGGGEVKSRLRTAAALFALFAAFLLIFSTAKVRPSSSRKMSYLPASWTCVASTGRSAFVTTLHARGGRSATGSPMGTSGRECLSRSAALSSGGAPTDCRISCSIWNLVRRATAPPVPGETGAPLSMSRSDLMHSRSTSTWVFTVNDSTLDMSLSRAA